MSEQKTFGRVNVTRLVKKVQCSEEGCKFRAVLRVYQGAAWINCCRIHARDTWLDMAGIDP